MLLNKVLHPMAKGLLTAILSLVFILAPAQICAGDVSLAWDASISEGVIGYRVYVGRASGNYDTFQEIPNQTTHTVTGLEPGLYYFAVTAFNSSGDESGYSNEVFTTVPADGPIFLGSLVSKRFFGVVITCTTDIDTSAIIRYKPSDGNNQWVVNFVTIGARRKNHTAVIDLDTGGASVYYKYQWEVTDAEGRTTLKEGTFLAQTD